jgi:integrase
VATPHELSRLLGALDVSDVLPFAIAAYAGGRRAEIRHARIDDVDLKLGVIYLGVDERGRKSRAAQRAVPLAKPLKIIVRRALLASKRRYRCGGGRAWVVGCDRRGESRCRGGVGVESPGWIVGGCGWCGRGRRFRAGEHGRVLRGWL